MFKSGNTIGAFRGPWGVRVEIDQSLLMLAGLLVYLSLGSSILTGVIFAAMLVASIFLHELGHAWGCLVQGVPVRRVVLFGGGGFCEHARSPSARADEFIVAMGPVVNLGLWAISGVASWALMTWFMADPMRAVGNFQLIFEINYYLAVFGWINLALFAFNLIPVQPLDGGKLFHHLMLRFMPLNAAHRATGAVGLVMSILWFPLAIWGFFTYGLILFFFPSPRAHYRMMKGDLSL